MMYFAYGSNLDDEDWSRFCEKHSISADCISPIGPAFLPDHELIFNVYSSTRGGGALNIKEQLGSYICGALFEVGDVGWQALDLKEGVEERVYRRVDKHVLIPNGSSIHAVTYEVLPESQSDFVDPTAAYVQAVRRGLKRFNFSEKRLIAAAADQQFPDAEMGIFTYGTLMSGECHHAKVESLGFVRHMDASANGLLYASEFDYPMMDISENKIQKIIKGELFYFSDLSQTIHTLDRLEGFSGFGVNHNEYNRTLINVTPRDEAQTLAWCYVARDLSAATKEITSGSWKQYRKTGSE
jgi:gamma-glutamylcyclotransferase (GGCT)/AIG2-like uncharacterized protein YtfP